jgi:hypothetical protein
MRGFLIALAAFLAVAIGGAAQPAASALAASSPASISAAPAVYALQIPDKKIEITVGDRDEDWYRNPMWIAIGVLAAIVIVLLAVVASRRRTIR